MRKCQCGCGNVLSGNTRKGPRRYVSGHNLRILKKTPAHCKAIAEAQRQAWKTKRHRLPIGIKHVNAQGYIIIKVVAGKGRWIGEHILIMEKLIGRKLRQREIVHHIDGDKKNNTPNNLYLCKNRSHHGTIHSSQNTTLRKLLKAGVVVFGDGYYEAVLPRE